MLPVTIEIMRKSVNRLTSLFPRKSVLNVAKTCVRTKISPGYLRHFTKTIYRIDGKSVFEMSFDKRTFCGRPVYDRKEATGVGGRSFGHRPKNWRLFEELSEEQRLHEMSGWSREVRHKFFLREWVIFHNDRKLKLTDAEVAKYKEEMT